MYIFNYLNFPYLIFTPPFFYMIVFRITNI